jgi:3-oxoacyl-[acyl-carrier-protein] synthase II
MNKRRVVITGIGAITPLGLNVKETWAGIVASKSGIKKIDRFNTERLPSKIAGLIDTSETGFNPHNFIPQKDVKKMDLFIQYAIAAAAEAVQDSGWMPTYQEDLDNTGVLVGSGIGGLREIESSVIHYHSSQTAKVSPFFIPASLINLISGHISIKYGFSGPNNAVVTACSSGAGAIGDATRIIQYGDANVMVAGGSEAAITEIGVAGFSSAKTLSTNYNNSPEKASRPWDKDRDGFVISEGAGIVVLEEYEHAKKRGAKIYAEIVGYGSTGDAYHITSPHPQGRGAKQAIKKALKDASLDPSKIDYINAHGTSTPVGDEIELRAVESMIYDYNNKAKMSSTKSAIGHLLGGTGAVELIFSALAIRDQVAPPTLNLDNPIDDIKINLVPHIAQDTKINYVLSNSFGFGGTNACLIIKKL